MQKTNFHDEPFEFENTVGSYRIERVVYEDGSSLPHSSSDLRFIHSLSPLELSVEGKEFFVPERSAIKVHPGVEVGITMGRGSDVYVVTFLTPEEEVLAHLKGDHADFFSSLEGKDREMWAAVEAEGHDYVLPGERNAEKMARVDGKVIIAPPHSRFNDMAPHGWLFMWARGSRALGMSSDVQYGIRKDEVLHMHKITSEVYTCYKGSLDMLVNGRVERINKGELLLVQPEEVHKKAQIVSFVEDKIPYAGSTMIFPSLQGDKYSPEGERLG